MSDESVRKAREIEESCSQVHDSNYPFYNGDESGACKACIASALDSQGKEANSREADLSDKNSNLHRLLAEKETEIERLKKKIIQMEKDHMEAMS